MHTLIEFYFTLPCTCKLEVHLSITLRYTNAALGHLLTRALTGSFAPYSAMLSDLPCGSKYLTALACQNSAVLTILPELWPYCWRKRTHFDNPFSTMVWGRIFKSTNPKTLYGEPSSCRKPMKWQAKNCFYHWTWSWWKSFFFCKDEVWKKTFLIR